MTSHATPSDADALERPSRAMLISLAVILAVGFLLRLIPVIWSVSLGGPVGGDPDGYASAAAYVADHPGRWMWVRDVVQFLHYLKAPLYPAMLCLFASGWRAAYPLNAAVFQMLLSGIAGLALFGIGRYLHSARAGLIATACFMFYLPNWAPVLFGQEGLFIPLSIVAFWLLFRAMREDGRLRAFGLTGFVFGLTALARSLPLYYLPPVAAWYVFLAADRRTAVRRMGVLLVVFLATILPYSAFISAKWGQFVFVDTQGVRAIVERYSDHPDTHNPGIVESLGMVAKAFRDAPAQAVAERRDRAFAFFYLKGGQWLQVVAPRFASAGAAWVLKAFVHLTHDLPTAAFLLLSPFGFALARHRRESVCLILWPLVALPLMIAFGWGGARYTASFLPQLMLGTAVVCAGAWRKPDWKALAAAAVCATLVAIPVLRSVPLTAWGQADYGIRFGASSEQDPPVGSATGRAGFGVLPEDGQVEVMVTPAGTLPAAMADAWIEVRIDGVRQSPIRFVPGRPGAVSLTTRKGLVFVELRVTSAAGEPDGQMNILITTGHASRGICATCP